MSAKWKNRFQNLDHLGYLYHSGREQGREAEWESRYKRFWGPQSQASSWLPAGMLRWHPHSDGSWQQARRRRTAVLPHCTPRVWWGPHTATHTHRRPSPIAGCFQERAQEMKQRSFLISFLGSSAWILSSALFVSYHVY